MKIDFSRRTTRNRFIAGLLAFSLVVGLYLVWPTSSQDFPANTSGPSTSITVVSGEFGSGIARDLFAHGVIKDSAHFVSVLLASGKSNLIQPGVHRVDTHIPSRMALEQMLDSGRISGLVTVIPGSTYSDFLDQLKRSGIDVSHISHSSPPLANKYNSLEGELGLASYAFTLQTSAQEAISQAVKNFQANSLPMIHSYGKYSEYEVLIIASLLQIEGDPQDYSKVAATIYSRLKIGMPLQLNSTVQYATSTRGRIDIGSSITSIRSSYNTYLNRGLPPTPISNPSNAAITAAQNPATGNWLYFITVSPHDTRFTNSYQQFLDWKSIYEKNLKAGKFK